MSKETITSIEQEHCVFRLAEAEHSQLSSFGSLDESLDVLIHAKEIELFLFEKADSRASYFKLIEDEIRMIEDFNESLGTYATFMKGIHKVIRFWEPNSFNE